MAFIVLRIIGLAVETFMGEIGLPSADQLDSVGKLTYILKKVPSAKRLLQALATLAAWPLPWRPPCP